MRIPEVLNSSHVAGATLYADRINALASWPRDANVAEIGVAYGNFSHHILTKSTPRLFDAYDTFILHTIPILWGRPTVDTFKGKTHRAFYEERFLEHISSNKVRVFEGDSSTLVAQQPSDFYDVVYIDADHGEAGVRKDVDAALKVLKADGLLVFNDYVFYDQTGRPYGVMFVVNELCVKHGWAVKYIALQQMMFADIALYRP